MAQVELSVLPSRVDLVNTNELPVSGIPSHRKQSRDDVCHEFLCTAHDALTKILTC